jgi:hypothetical protein
MKRAIAIFAICAGAVLFAAGCSKTADPPLPKAAPPVPAVQGTLSTPTLPSAPLPDPVVPKGAEAPAPTPGQAGDTSSPTFKAGGKADPHK